jgi:hypothetical protein
MVLREMGCEEEKWMQLAQVKPVYLLSLLFPHNYSTVIFAFDALV